jgi:hypothetical protein
MLNPWLWNPECSAYWDAWFDTPFGVMHLEPMCSWIRIMGKGMAGV